MLHFESNKSKMHRHYLPFTEGVFKMQANGFGTLGIEDNKEAQQRTATALRYIHQSFTPSV